MSPGAVILNGITLTKLNGTQSVLIKARCATNKSKVKTRSYYSRLDPLQKKYLHLSKMFSLTKDSFHKLTLMPTFLPSIRSYFTATDSFQSISRSLTWKSLRLLQRLDPLVVPKALISSDSGKSKNYKIKWTTFLPKAICAAMGIAYMEYYLFKQDLARVVPENVENIDRYSQSFVDIYDPMEYPIPQKWQGLIPWVTKCASLDRALALRLVEETKSNDPTIRSAAIRKLAGLRNLSDAEYRAIAFMVDFKTGIELANSDADYRMVSFKQCRYSKHYDVLLPTKFRELFDALPPDNIHPEVNAMVRAAISHYSPTEVERDEKYLDSATGFESEPITVTRQKTFSEIQLIYHCLLGVLSHTRNKEQIPIMFKCGLVDLLSDISMKYNNNITIMSIVSKVLGNLSWHPDFYQEVKNSGVLRLISELSHSNSFQVNLPCRKALHNLDRSSATAMLPPGIYQLYPDFKTDELLLTADIVLIHGVKGSTFRTWRSHDSLASWRLGSESRMEDKQPNKLTLAGNMKGRISGLKDYVPFLKTHSGDMDVSAKSKGNFREKLRILRERLYLPENPILGNDEEVDHKPLNREYRNGELYYFQEGEEVVLEPLFMAAQPTPCWPRDWLPKDIGGARILSVDYDSFVSHWYAVQPIETHGRTVKERSKELVEKLISADVGSRPIIWVTHSAGGLLAKQIIQSASESDDPAIRKLCTNTKGVFFYSTPHFGSSLASLTTTGNLLLPTIEMKEMAAGSPFLKALNDKFRTIAEANNFRITSFGEMLGTKTGVGVYVKMVSLKSSDPGYGEFYAVKADHVNICKPTSRGSFVYTKLAAYINKLLKDLNSK